MRMSRKGALLMLIVVLLWSALPASAFLLTSRSTGLPPCCRGMGQSCPMRGTGLGCAACGKLGENVAVAPEAPPAQAQTAVFLPYRTSLLLCDASGPQGQFAFDAPPPEPSPGGVSILRI